MKSTTPSRLQRIITCVPIVLVFAFGIIGSTARLRVEAAGSNFLWKATRNQSSVYLLGSVHLLTKDFYRSIQRSRRRTRMRTCSSKKLISARRRAPTRR